MRTIGVSLMAIGAGVGLSFAPIVWIVRDGLGPRAIETAGWAALGAFIRTYFRMYVGWGVIGLVILGYALCIASRRNMEKRVEG